MNHIKLYTYIVNKVVKFIALIIHKNPISMHIAEVKDWNKKLPMLDKRYIIMLA
jgi:hypothetical protein